MRPASEDSGHAESSAKIWPNGAENQAQRREKGEVQTREEGEVQVGSSESLSGKSNPPSTKPTSRGSVAVLGGFALSVRLPLVVGCR
jgi:hypothetical protein